MAGPGLGDVGFQMSEKYRVGAPDRNRVAHRDAAGFDAAWAHRADATERRSPGALAQATVAVTGPRGP